MHLLADCQFLARMECLRKRNTIFVVYPYGIMCTMGETSWVVGGKDWFGMRKCEIKELLSKIEIPNYARNSKIILEDRRVEEEQIRHWKTIMKKIASTKNAYLMEMNISKYLVIMQKYQQLALEIRK